MNNQLKEMCELINSDQENSEWSKQCKYESRTKEFIGEVEEIKKAIENKDYENLKEELGDELWDLVYTIYMAEKECPFTSEEVINGIIEEIKRRKPWVVQGRKDTREELKIWNEIKEKEKKGEFK